MPIGARQRVRRFVLASEMLIPSATSAVPMLTTEAGKRKHLVPNQIREAIWQVGMHETPDAVLIHRGVRVPSVWRRLARLRLRKKLDDSRWAKRAMKQVISYLATAGQERKSYVPLISCHHPDPQYIFHVKGVECWINSEDTHYPHKLPDQPSTLYPMLPYGPALFGEERAQFAGSLSPDLVVFICLDKFRRGKFLKKIGPRLYSINQIKDELSTHVFDGLRERAYKIDPDPNLGVWPISSKNRPDPADNPFGGVGPINLLGRENRKLYMRFHIKRAAGFVGQMGGIDGIGFIADLRLALQRMKSKPECGRLDLQRGDILIVNNRRVATEWEDRCELSPFGSKHDLKEGDRTLFQMGFYYPGEI